MDFLLANLNLPTAEKGETALLQPAAALGESPTDTTSGLEGNSVDLVQIIDFKEIFSKVISPPVGQEPGGQETRGETTTQGLTIYMPLDTGPDPAEQSDEVTALMTHLPDEIEIRTGDGDALPVGGKSLPEDVARPPIVFPSDQQPANIPLTAKNTVSIATATVIDIPAVKPTEPQPVSASTTIDASPLATDETRVMVSPIESDLQGVTERLTRIETQGRTLKNEQPSPRLSEEPIRVMAESGVSPVDRLKPETAGTLARQVLTNDQPDHVKADLPADRPVPAVGLQSIKQVMHSIEANADQHSIADRSASDTGLDQLRPTIVAKTERLATVQPMDTVATTSVKPVASIESEAVNRPVYATDAKWQSDTRLANAAPDPLTVLASNSKSVPDVLPADVIPLRAVESAATTASGNAPIAVQPVHSAPQVQLNPIALTHADPLNPGRHADATEWGNGLGERVSWMINQKHSSATIRIDPPILGKLDVQVKVADDSTLITIQTQHAQTRDIIESASHRLRDYLQDNGYQNVNVDVSQRQDNAQSHGQQADANSEVGEDLPVDQTTESATLISSQNYVTDGLIDTFA